MFKLNSKTVIAIAFIMAILSVSIGCKKTTIVSVEDLPLSSAANSKTVGTSANELLTGSKLKLVIEIQYMTGYQLQQASVNNLVTFLQSYLNKPGGVQVIQKEIPVTGADTKSLADIAKLEQQYRTAFNTDEQVAAHILVTNSNYTTNNVLGVAYRNTSVCLFGKTIQNNSGGLGQASRVKIETTILNHEFGHLLGLVDLGSPMQVNHRDANHEHHCTATNCLMYYAAETTDILGVLLSGNSPSLDANCQNDLRANGGK